MALKVNIGGTWKTVLGIFCNVGGTWKTATDVSCNIGGAWKNAKELSYYGTATALSQTRYSMGYISFNGHHALFGGGKYENGNWRNSVNAYDTNLTRTAPSGLVDGGYGRADMGGAVAGNYALFAGGYGYDGIDYKYYDTVTAYDASLVRTTPTALSSARVYMASATIGNYAIFQGGLTSSGYTATADYYDNNLTRTYTGTGSTRANSAGAFNDNYALIGGGRTDSTSYITTVKAYASNLTITTPTALSSARGMLAATRVGEYVLFAGGRNNTAYYTRVDAYNASLTRSTPTELSQARYDLASATLCNNDFAVFGGGRTGRLESDDLAYYNTVDVYDKSLVRTTYTLSENKACVGGASVGDYVLFAGGLYTNNEGYSQVCYTTVDVFQYKL